MNIALNRQTPRSRGFTLLEMLTTVAALIIVLGVMVSLARYVRNALAVEVTKDLLHRMDSLVQQYMVRHEGHVPVVTAFVPPVLPAQQLPAEDVLQRTAEENNRSFVLALRTDGLLADETFSGLPQSIYNDAMLRDAWGTPIVFMPAMHEGIGMAPQDKPFFFSAGPDQRFLSQENNLYSYER
jgi:Tfp pilus assembly protein PilE